MEQVVIDASVFVKLIIREEYSENAIALRDSYISRRLDIIVPSLFPYEVMNAAKYSKSYTVTELETLGETLDNYRFGVFEFGANYSRAITKMANKHDITVYDAAYVALAEMTGSILYTADSRLIRDTGLPFVRHIKEFTQQPGR